MTQTVQWWLLVENNKTYLVSIPKTEQPNHSDSSSNIMRIKKRSKDKRYWGKAPDEAVEFEKAKNPRAKI